MPQLNKRELAELRTELNNDTAFVDDCAFGHAGTDAMQAVERATSENPKRSESELAERLLELM